jgi:thiol-disulfide isomerase/thioredoxin
VKKMSALSAAMLLLAIVACRKEEEVAEPVAPVAGVLAKSGNLKVGMPAPALSLTKVLQAPAGTKASWDALRGKAVVLEFWATWCVPCVAAFPHINGLAEKYKDKPIQFIAITTETEPIVTKFLKKKHLSTWVGLDTEKTVNAAYGINAIPVTVLVDAQGKLAGFTYPTEVTEKVLDDLIAGRPVTVAAGGSPAAVAASASLPTVAAGASPAESKATESQPARGEP